MCRLILFLVIILLSNEGNSFLHCQLLDMVFELRMFPCQEDVVEMDGVLICWVMFVCRYKIIFDGDDMLRSPIGPLLRALYAQLQISTDNIYPLTALPFLNLPRYLPSTSSIRILILYVWLYGCLVLVNMEDRSFMECTGCELLASFVCHISPLK